METTGILLVAIIVAVIIAVGMIYSAASKRKEDEEFFGWVLYFDKDEKKFVELTSADYPDNEALALIYTSGDRILVGLNKYIIDEHYKISTVSQAFKVVDAYIASRCAMEGDVKNESK